VAIVKLLYFRKWIANFPIAIMTTDILSTETLEKVENFQVFDKDGKEVQFGSLYADQETLVIFIRHFLCGNCMVPLNPRSRS